MSEEKEKIRRHAEEEESREKAIRPGLPDSTLCGPQKCSVTIVCESNDNTLLIARLIRSIPLHAQTSGPLDSLMQNIVMFTSTAELEHNIDRVLNKVLKNNDGAIT